MTTSNKNWQDVRVEKEKELENSIYGEVMVSLEKASEILFTTVDQNVTPLKEFTERVDLWDAGDRVIAEDVNAEDPVPPFDRSVLDGYALNSKDTTKASPENPCKLEIIDEVPAGYVAKNSITTGKAIKIFTGAPIPENVDAVARSEEVEESYGYITLKKAVISNAGIAPKGEEIKEGDCVISEGEIVKPAHLSLLASLGRASIAVRRKPRVGLFCTGDELFPVKGSLPPGKIRVSNLYTLAQLVRKAGGEPVDLGIARDNPEDMARVLSEAGDNNLDMLLSTGGVSSGDYDLVKDAMHFNNFNNLFWKIAVRPGAPVAASYKDGLLWIALSGNPSGAILVTLLLVLPVIAHLAGVSWKYNYEKAALQSPIFRKKGLRGFYWGKYEEVNGERLVYPFMRQHCGSMLSYLNSNCLLSIPSGKVDWSKGETVKILCL